MLHLHKGNCMNGIHYFHSLGPTLSEVQGESLATASLLYEANWAMANWDPLFVHFVSFFDPSAALTTDAAQLTSFWSRVETVPGNKGSFVCGEVCLPVAVRLGALGGP